MEKISKIYIAGHTGLVGSAIVRSLQASGYSNFVFTPYPEYDLRNQQVVDVFFKKERPEYVFLAAAKVGGILANNTYPAEFAYDNLMIQNNIIHSAYEYHVTKLLFLGSSCIYPKMCPQPIKEEYLLTGPLEKTNEAYAIAKIAGLKLCAYYNTQYHTDFISAMPTNLYGPGDNYNLETSHVLPALIRKFHLARCLETTDWQAIRKDLQKRPINGSDGTASEKEILDILSNFGIHINSPVRQYTSSPVTISLWGSGKVYREFMHVDDLADALLFLMDNYAGNEHINIGTGIDCSVAELAEIIKNITGFSGTIIWDTSKPDGTPKKLLNVDNLQKLGWKSSIMLNEGLRMVINNYSLD
jgi:GDP-L-fucose synthase